MSNDAVVILVLLAVIGSLMAMQAGIILYGARRSWRASAWHMTPTSFEIAALASPDVGHFRACPRAQQARL